VDSWIKVLTDTPYEIHAAAADAQRIFDYVMAFEKKIEQKQEATKAPEYNPNTLQTGDKIKYNGTTYEVLEADKKNFLIKDVSNKHKVQLTVNDGLFNSLVESKRINRNTVSVLDTVSNNVKEPDYSIPTAKELVAQEDNSFKRKI
jgi:CRISPR/Cas system CMR subunit Cmr4 (Cas7 group RAMP superfamily)